MADNTTLNPGTGGDLVRTIDRGGIKTQVMALDLGGEAGPESLVSGGALPVAPRPILRVRRQTPPSSQWPQH